jgi:hypothetical protein
VIFFMRLVPGSEPTAIVRRERHTSAWIEGAEAQIHTKG